VGARDYEEAAAKRGVPFISVILDCNLEENLKKLGNKDRGRSTTKLIDMGIVRAIREAEQIYRFGRVREREMDITCKGRGEAALEILEHVRRSCELGYKT
jgi:hypothetical protein